MTDEERAAFKEKIRSVGFAKSLRNPRPREFRNDKSQLVKEVTDEAANVTTFTNTGDTERVDVMIYPQTVVQKVTE